MEESLEVSSLSQLTPRPKQDPKLNRDRRYIRAPVPAPSRATQVANLQNANTIINGMGTPLGVAGLPVEPLITNTNVIAAGGLGPPLLPGGGVAPPAAVIRANNRILRSRNIPLP